jgi:hypothetical protein
VSGFEPDPADPLRSGPADGSSPSIGSGDVSVTDQDHLTGNIFQGVRCSASVISLFYARASYFEIIRP